MIVEHPRDNLPRLRRGVRLADCNHAGATRRTCYQEGRRGPVAQTQVLGRIRNRS
jgi:hypothetical protein